MSSTKHHIVMLGATSAVAIAYARKKVSKGTTSFSLLGRSEEKLRIVADDLKARGASDVETIAGAVGDPSRVPSIFGQVVDGQTRIDEVCLAYGELGNQAELQTHISDIQRLLEVNYVSTVMWMEFLARHFEQQGFGQLTVIGSVAGDRGRQSNYLYGSTKSGLERVAEGMAHRFASQKNITVTLVKPGFIDTPMTKHIDTKGGPLWSSPETIADIMDRAVTKKTCSRLCTVVLALHFAHHSVFARVRYAQNGALGAQD